MVGSARGFGSSTAGHLLWRALAERVSSKVSADAFESIRSSTRLLGTTPGSLRIGVPQHLLERWVQEGYLTELESALTALTDGARALAAIPFPAERGNSSLDPTLTLERYITGPSNQRARDAALSILKENGAPVPLLVIVGPPGCGKTHLIQGVAHACASRAPRDERKVLYREARGLEFDLIAAISTGELEAFRQALRDCSILLIDDAEKLAGRDATQTELAAVLDALRERGTPVFVSASASPEELDGLMPELRERLGCGRIVELCAPEWETRVAILFDRARQWGVELAQDVASFLVYTAGTDVAALDVLLTQLLGQPGGRAAAEDADLAQAALDRGLASHIRAPASAVVALVARHFNLRVRDLRSAGRSRRVTVPRQLAMYLLRQHSQLSFPEIGKRFGRHHTTALHSCRRVKRDIQEDSTLRTAVRVLEKELLRLAEESG